MQSTRKLKPYFMIRCKHKVDEPDQDIHITDDIVLRRHHLLESHYHSKPHYMVSVSHSELDDPIWENGNGAPAVSGFQHPRFNNAIWEKIINHTHQNSLEDGLDSIELSLQSDQNEEELVSFMKGIPEGISRIFFSSQYDFCSPATVTKLIQASPPHITSFEFPSMNFDELQSDTLTKLFSAFKQGVKKICIGGSSDVDRSSDAELRPLLIHLPFSLVTLTITGRKLTQKINMDSFRRRNYFPASYFELAAEAKTLYEIAKNIFGDYAKGDDCYSGIKLFFTGHLGRHYTQEIRHAINTTSNYDALMSAIEKIQIENPTGSLARRKKFMKYWELKHPELRAVDEKKREEDRLIIDEDDSLSFSEAEVKLSLLRGSRS